MTTISEIRSNTIKSAFTLARSLKRRPNPAEHHFPMGVERTLTVINGNDGLSSRDLGEALDIRPSSVTELVNRLQEAGLVTRKEDEADKRVSRISLTEKGRRVAHQVFDRHRLLRSFLIKLGVSRRIADRDACLMEHILSAETLERIRTYTGAEKQ